MKIFWSWQSDTPGKTGRFFIRECLNDAITLINQGDQEITEPPERTRDPLTLDQDRIGVAGHRNLGDTILGKIAASNVFVGDVTLVAELKIQPTADNTDGAKKLINSNVAIEYGFAVGKLTDDATLLVMNLHYGPLTKLPFDLAYKIAPCRYTLAPDASKDEIARQKKALTKELVEILKLHAGRLKTPVPRFIPIFPEIRATTNAATFWNPRQPLVQFEEPHGFRAPVRHAYLFDAPRVLYLRLIPTRPLPNELAMTQVRQVVERRRNLPMVINQNLGMPHRNQWGGISYISPSSDSQLLAFTQIHRNGEIWGVTAECAGEFNGMVVIPMVNVLNHIRRGLREFATVAADDLTIKPPYMVRVGIVGIKGMHAMLPGNRNAVSAEILDDTCSLEKKFDSVTPEAIETLVTDFGGKLYDLADVEWP